MQCCNHVPRWISDNDSPAREKKNIGSHVFHKEKQKQKDDNISMINFEKKNFS